MKKNYDLIDIIAIIQLGLNKQEEINELISTNKELIKLLKEVKNAQNNNQKNN